MELIRMLLHKIFGWHYITFSFGYGAVICRVKVWPSGVKTVAYYGTIAYLDEKNKTLSTGKTYVELA